jgi:hypothetical protein
MLASVMAACTRPGEAVTADYHLPAESEWRDHGLIFTAGEAGEWDAYLYGGFTATVVKKNGSTFLYYQGASGYRTEPDETVTGRAIGVATSVDGLTFVKAAENPVLTWFPTAEDGEEGATSGAAVMDDAGTVVLFYGANTAINASLVNADGRLARSANGLHFTDEGIVLDHHDRALWAAGDELFPIMAIHDDGQWFVFYLPNGGLAGRHLGVAWGPAPDRLNESSAVRHGLGRIGAWGTAGYAEIGDDLYAVFLNDVARAIIEVRLLQ